MAQALYHPEHGYYSTTRRNRTPRRLFHQRQRWPPLFGELLARSFVEIWERLGQIEISLSSTRRHHGQFARDVSNHRGDLPNFFLGSVTRFVEPFSALQDRQSQGLKEFGDRVLWRRSLESSSRLLRSFFQRDPRCHARKFARQNLSALRATNLYLWKDRGHTMNQECLIGSIAFQQS